MSNLSKGQDPVGDALLELAAAGDPRLLSDLRARAASGEPIPYLAGFLIFRGRRFAIDRRAYITDPELGFLVDLVVAEGDQFERQNGRAPRILEFGTGAGTLLITLALERPHWKFAGLDVNRQALELAEANARSYSVCADWIPSDFFSAWNGSERALPDIVFGDPPWGTTDDLYDDERDGNYYAQMPPSSAFPPSGSRTGTHDELIREWVRLRWNALLLLNFGVLPREVIDRSVAPLPSWSLIHPEPGLSVVRACSERERGFVD